MALSLDKLWKDASDEAQRRGLTLEIPSVESAASSSSAAAEAAPAANARIWLIVALAVAGVAAIGYFV